MPDIFINTERPVDRSIVAGLNQPQREAASSAWVAGSSYDVNLYFVQNDGTYDAASGQAGQTVELAIAPVSEPESGTFTLTDGTDTTAALSFGASGQDVEDALNELNSDTGPNLGTASLVDVEKVSDTQYAITFRTLGAMTALSGSSVSLYPESTVTGSIAVTGSGTQYAQQVIEVVRQPAIYQPTWSTITNGFNATVALNTTRLLQAMVLERGEPFFLEIRLNGTTVAREVVTVEESNMPASAFSGTAIASVLDAFAADPTSNAYFDADAWSAVLSIAAGNGDVVGPASAVDSNFAAFDSTTGKLIKDALVSASSFATAAQGALADSASQPGHTHTASDVTDFDTEVSNNTTVAGNEAYTPRVLSGTAKTATFTAVIGETHLVNTSGGGFTANLPAIAGGQGRIAFLFTGTGGNLTVDPSGAETIGGKATLRLDHGHNTIENDGTEWKLVQRSGVAPFRIDPAQITANQDGYNPADWNNNVTHLFIDSDASREIQGFEEDGFHDMAQVIVTNDGANDIIIKHDTSTTVANRVLVDGGADFTLGANQSGILMRDGTVNKWRFYGINQDLTSYQLKPAEGAFVDGDKNKLDGIEAGADVTDTANVTAAGALMDSEVDADIKTLSLPASTTISTFGATLVDDADAATARTTLGVDAAGTDNSVEVISIACSDETTDLTTGTAKATFRMPFAMTLTAVRASVTTAPTGSTLIVDINEERQRRS